MKLDASAMISRHTSASSRNLLAFSATVFLISFYELGNNSSTNLPDGVIRSEWKLFGVQIPDSMFEFTVVALMLFFFVNHILHWYADYQIYTKWYRMSSAPIETVGGANARYDGESTRGKLDAILEKLKTLENGDNTQRNPEFEDLTDSITRMNAILSRMETNFSDVSLILKIQVFGWYFGLPIIVWVAAIVTFLCKCN